MDSGIAVKGTPTLDFYKNRVFHILKKKCTRSPLGQIILAEKRRLG